MSQQSSLTRLVSQKTGLVGMGQSRSKPEMDLLAGVGTPADPCDIMLYALDDGNLSDDNR